MRIAPLFRNLQDWLPGVAGSDPRLGFGFWGVSLKEGACTSPLFHFVPADSVPQPIAFPQKRRAIAKSCSLRASHQSGALGGPFGERAACVWKLAKKNERPVGGPAARAWGMEGTVIRSWGSQEQAATNSRLQKRFCR